MIMVILVHSRQRIPDLSIIFSPFKLGQLGCQIFFFCSGYLLMKSYGKNGQSSGIRTFLWKRYASIIPGYWLIIAITFVLNSIALKTLGTTIGFAANRSLISITCNLLLIQGLLRFCNNSVFNGGWYIGTTVVLYWLTPLIYKQMKRIKRHALLVPLIFAVASLILAACISGLGYKWIFNNNEFYYFSFMTQLPSFIIGCILYFDNHPQKREINGGRQRLNILTGILLLVGSAACYWLGENISVLSFLFLVMPTLFTFGVYFISRTVEMDCAIEKKTFLHRLIMWFGRNSYYVFLAHPFFVWSMPLVVLMVFQKIGLAVNTTVVYIILLPLMFAGSAMFGKILKCICEPVCRKLKSIRM